MKAADIVKNSRKDSKITTWQLLTTIFDDFTEFHGDRSSGEDKAIIGGLAFLNNQPVTVIATDKGENTQERIEKHFGCPEPSGYRKSLRLMKQAEKFNRPVITLINTAGAYPGKHAEEAGQGSAIAQNLYEISQLKVPVIGIIFGEGGSGGALALACGDQIWMTTDSMYSILSPEGFASILWKDSKRSDEAAEIMQLTPDALLKGGIVEGIIPELKDKTVFCNNIKKMLVEQLDDLKKVSIDKLIENRYDRFRKF